MPAYRFPLVSFFSASFWYPFARLSYGAWLCAPIFMIFRSYNVEKGIWACEIDAFLFFFAFLAFAFAFSLLITVLIETPTLRLYSQFILGKSQIPKEPAFKQRLTSASFAEAYQKRRKLEEGSKSITEGSAESLDDESISPNHSFVTNSSSATKSRINAAEKHEIVEIRNEDELEEEQEEDRA